MPPGGRSSRRSPTPATSWARARPATASPAPSPLAPPPPAHAPADIDGRRAAQPWYRTKTEPAFEDMLIKLRRTMIAARFSQDRPGQPEPGQIRAVLAAWDAATA